MTEIVVNSFDINVALAVQRSTSIKSERHPASLVERQADPVGDSTIIDVAGNVVPSPGICDRSTEIKLFVLVLNLNGNLRCIGFAVCTSFNTYCKSIFGLKIKKFGRRNSFL